MKLGMKENVASMMKKPFTSNPMTRMWTCVDSNSLLRHSLFEFLKVIELVMVLGSVQDECTFSTVTFMKTRVQNHFTTHCVDESPKFL
jgi:hypothetical protein